MTEDGGVRVSSDESQTRQRKKRKWDQPAESFVAAGLAVPGVLPLNNLGPFPGAMFPGVPPIHATLLTNPIAASSVVMSPVFPVPSIVQHSCAVNPKLNQVKIQEDLVIAREIVINDAEPSIRSRLTKRQTQEEIQKSTGAVVITRGKFRPPNAPPDDEKPLYLHISSGAHLKETAERIIAVDRAAAMVEEMIKQGPNPISTGVQAAQSLNACIYLGFDVDPSWDIATRIRGPNDQYISHIMNETGASVSLRGCGSGVPKSLDEEVEPPLHLFLSSNNPKSLEDAKRLAENLLDTISAEYGFPRILSTKVYAAVPPPQQLLAATQSVGSELKPITNLTAPMASSVGSIAVPAVSSGALPNLGNYPQPSVTGGSGTSYRGYEGIYPQATPLQQVALALRQSPSISSSLASAATSTSVVAKSSASSGSEKEKRPPQKRKFQELPAGQNGPSRQNQILKSVKPGERGADAATEDFGILSSPKRSVPPLPNGIPPSSYKSMAPPPPPPKFCSSKQNLEVMSKKSNVLMGTKSDPVPDTLAKLVEYGEEDDDPDEAVEDPVGNDNSSTVNTQKPFWAV